MKLMASSHDHTLDSVSASELRRRIPNVDFVALAAISVTARRILRGSVCGRRPAPKRSITTRSHSQPDDRNTPPPSPSPNRETPRTSIGGAMGRLEKAIRRPSSMHVRGESDDGIVPSKPPNNAGTQVAAEEVEKGRRPRGARCKLPRSGLRAGTACRLPCNSCEKWRNVTDAPSSLPSCTTLRRTFSGKATTHSNVGQHRGSTK